MLSSPAVTYMRHVSLVTVCVWLPGVVTQGSCSHIQQYGSEKGSGMHIACAVNGSIHMLVSHDVF